MKPIYEVYVRQDLTHELYAKIKSDIEKRMPEFEVFVFSDSRFKCTKTKIIYPTATFWGWWYNLWNA